MAPLFDPNDPNTAALLQGLGGIRQLAPGSQTVQAPNGDISKTVSARMDDGGLGGLLADAQPPPSSMGASPPSSSHAPSPAPKPEAPSGGVDLSEGTIPDFSSLGGEKMPDVGKFDRPLDTPVLAPPDNREEHFVKNPILNGILRAGHHMIGFGAPSPEPGQPYHPMGWGGKLSRVLSVAGGVGDAFAAAAGSPVEKEMAERRVEQRRNLPLEQQKLEQQAELSRAQLRAETSYRTGMLGINQQKANTSEERAQIAREALDPKFEAAGLMADPNHPGKTIPIPPEEIPNHPGYMAALEAKASQSDKNRALAEAARAGNDPDSPKFQLAYYSSLAKLAMSAASLNMRSASLGMHNAEDVLNYGQSTLPGGAPPQVRLPQPPAIFGDAAGAQQAPAPPAQIAAAAGSPTVSAPVGPVKQPQGMVLNASTEAPQMQQSATRPPMSRVAPPRQAPAANPTAQHGQLNIDNAPGEMLVNTATGQPIPYKMLATLKPTMQEINRADFAKSAIESANKIQELVKSARAAQVGPFQGRVNELMARAGLGDKFNQELQNYMRFAQSAATAAHTGRFSVPILNKMDKQLSPAMNPDQLDGAVESINSVMSKYADRGWRPTVAEWKEVMAGQRSSPGGTIGPKAGGANSAPAGLVNPYPKSNGRP